MTPRSAARIRWAILAAPPVVFLAAFFVYPVSTILAAGLVGEGGFGLGSLARVATEPYVRDVLWFTVWQAALSTLVTVLVALPGAYAFARYDFRGKRFVRAAATVPFVLPTIVVASAFLAVLGPRSPVNAVLMDAFALASPPIRLDGSIWAVLAAHVFYNYAVVLRVVGASWSHLDPALEEAARTLGAGRWRVFREVTLPLLRPAIASAASIVFLFTFTSFGVILLLGGSGYTTLEVEIYRQTAQLLDLPVAAALAVIQLVAVTAVLLAYARYQERAAVPTRLRSAATTPRRPATRGDRLLVAGNLALMALLLGAPLAVLAERSVATPRGYGLAFYEALWGESRRAVLFVRPIEAVSNSLVFAGVTGLIAVSLGLIGAAAITRRRGWASRGLDTLLMLPLGTSAVIVGFGFLLALDEPPLDLRSSAVLIPLAHALIAIPFVVRATVPLLRSIDRRLREAAAVLGASPARIWREVELPVVARAAAAGAALAVAVSLGEFGATLFIARPDVPTLPVAVFRLLGQPGPLNFGQAMAMSTLLMLLTGAAVLLVERVRGAGERPF